MPISSMSFTGRMEYCVCIARALTCLFALSPTIFALEIPPLVPAPREVKWAEGSPLALPPESVAIVIGQKAADPEREAARLLQEFVAKTVCAELASAGRGRGKALPQHPGAAGPANDVSARG